MTSPMTDDEWAAAAVTFEFETCPACGGHLVTVQGGGLDQVYCLGCQRYADQEA